MSTPSLPQPQAPVIRVPFVDLHAQYLGIKLEIDAAIADVIATSSFICSRHVDLFEQAWAATLGVKHCVSCANGTDALYQAHNGYIEIYLKLGLVGLVMLGGRIISGFRNAKYEL